MNSYQRVLRTVHHEKPDRPPVEFLATGEVIASLCRYLDLPDEEALLADLGIDFRKFAVRIQKSHTVPEEIASRYARSEIEVTPYGVVLVKSPDFPQGHRVHGPFYETKDLDGFAWPKPEDVQSGTAVEDTVRRHNAAGYCTIVYSDNPFKLAYFMRPFEDFMVDCILDPNYAFELIERIAEVEIRRAETGVRAGARCALMAGDFADQRNLLVSPDTFRRVLKPALADHVQRLKRINPDVLVFLHSDGNLMSILPDLIECGFHAVHPLQPECMDMDLVKKRYGDRLTLFGGISVQSELPGSDPNSIRTLVRARIDALGAGGGFMLAPSNTILPDVPPESILAMYREATKTHADR